jgi:RNA polymerase primary sigma factor
MSEVAPIVDGYEFPKETDAGMSAAVGRTANLHLVVDDAELPLAEQNRIKEYLNELGKIPLLEAEEELDLAKRIEKGDLEAKAKLIESNVLLVAYFSKNYVGNGMPFDDLMQEGTLGLIRAVEKFDYRKGFRFSTYAAPWIHKMLGEAIKVKVAPIRVPRYLTEPVGKVRKVEKELVGLLGCQPDDEEIAERLVQKYPNVDEETAHEFVRKAKEIPRVVVSLDKELGGEQPNKLTLGDRTLKVDDFIEEVEQSERDSAVHMALEELEAKDSRVAEVLRLRFGIGHDKPHNLNEIGKILGLTGERIRQLENEGLSELSGQDEFLAKVS